MVQQEIETFYPANRQEWRQWLQENCATRQAIWLIYHKPKSSITTLTYSEAVEEALCFGWIDSTLKPVDADKFMQFFSKRKPHSVWSRINKEKVERLINTGIMTQAGIDCIDLAKKNGYWAILDEVEALQIPDDLDQEFSNYSGSKDFFLSLSKSVKKMLLQWLVLAKRPETRQKRITEIATLAAQKLKPKQFR